MRLFFGLAQPAFVLLLAFCALSWTHGNSGSSAFPGQPGDLVGFANTPANVTIGGHTYSNAAYPGSLTAWPGGTGLQVISSGAHATSGSGTTGDPWVFAFYDFSSGTAGVDITVANATFIGCRFQSNQTADYNVFVQANNVNFSYDSFVPLVSLQSNYPGLGTTWAWPSNGFNAAVFYNNPSPTPNPNTYTAANGNGYEFGVRIGTGFGPTNIDHSEFWDFGNAISWDSTSAGTSNITDNWLHDAANTTNNAGTPIDYHIDGPGALDGGSPPSNIVVHHNSISFLGNNNPIAFQGATSVYNGITITNNWLSGGNDTFALSVGRTDATNQTVTDNIFDTSFPLYQLFDIATGPTAAATLFTQTSNPTNLWRRNTLNVAAGSAPQPSNTQGGTPFQFTGTNSGNFIWPDGSLNSTDWPN